MLVGFHLSAMVLRVVRRVRLAQASDFTLKGRYALAGVLRVHRSRLRVTSICVSKIAVVMLLRPGALCSDAGEVTPPTRNS